MKHYMLNAEQRALSGHSDLFIINHTDLTATADNTAEEVVLDGLVLGDIVEQNAIIEVITPWACHSDMTTTVSVGVVGTVTAITPTLAITTAGTGLAAGNAVVSANQTNAGYVASTGINLICNFAADADAGFDEFTAGQLAIWLNISRAADRRRSVIT